MEEPKVRRERLDFLDWLRTLMVSVVVHAHVARSLGQQISEAQGGFIVDTSSATLAQSLHLGPHASAHAGELSSIVVRWASIIRQYCLPLLFWVSGAAAACSFKGIPRGTVKLLLFSAIGMSANAACWYLGPRSPRCSPPGPGQVARCEGEGVLFDFTTVAHSGTLFPIVFQMWYTAFLVIFAMLSWPLFIALSGSSTKGRALTQQTRLMFLFASWFLACAVYAAAVVAVAGNLQGTPLGAWFRLACYETLFHGLAFLTTRCGPRDLRIPVRLLHYALAGVVVWQFAEIPLAEVRLNAGYAFYIFVGFNKFFALGFVMTHARARPGEGGGVDAEPMMSRAWPSALILAAILAPSTNWYTAGNLTYAYLPRDGDRKLYVCGACAVIFLVDRASRALTCERLPDFVGNAALLTYLFHPVAMHVLIASGVRTAGTVTFTCYGIFLAMSAAIALPGALGSKRPLPDSGPGAPVITEEMGPINAAAACGVEIELTNSWSSSRARDPNVP